MLCYAKSLQSCPTLCDPIDDSPPGSSVPGILQARTLEWVAISFSNAGKRKVKVKSLSCVRLLATPWTAACQAPLSMDFPGKGTGVGCHCLLQIKDTYNLQIQRKPLLTCDIFPHCLYKDSPIHHHWDYSLYLILGAAFATLYFPV